jgi:checkpoint serine/threonine-protein kinase
MAQGDLIDFDIIETQKENIQSLPSGRSAKALATLFSPVSKGKASSPSQTQNLNDVMRQDFRVR